MSENKPPLNFSKHPIIFESLNKKKDKYIFIAKCNDVDPLEDECEDDEIMIKYLENNICLFVVDASYTAIEIIDWLYGIDRTSIIVLNDPTVKQNEP